MFGLESVPHRIGEKVLGEIVHCYGKTPVGALDVRNNDSGAAKAAPKYRSRPGLR
jgi:hypothetical protein